MFVDDLFNKKTLTESSGGGSPWHSEPEQQQIDANRRGRLEREREPAGSDAIDARLRAQNDQLAKYAQTGKFWIKQKDTQQHISDEFVGKAAANAAALELLKQRPELKGNIVITAYGPDETPGVAEGMLDNPGAQDSLVASAIIRRILLQRTDLLSKYGPEKVGQAVDEVADFVGDVEEIGSSDVSGWIRHVEQMLGNMNEQGVAEDNNPVAKIKAPRAPSSPALAAPKAPAVAETIAKVERMLESVTSKKSADMIRAYVDQRFTELGLRNTTECRNIMARVVQESAIRRRQHAKSLAN